MCFEFGWDMWWPDGAELLDGPRDAQGLQHQLSEEKNGLKVMSYEFRNGWAALPISRQGDCSLYLTLPFATLIALFFFHYCPSPSFSKLTSFFFFPKISSLCSWSYSFRKKKFLSFFFLYFFQFKHNSELGFLAKLGSVCSFLSSSLSWSRGSVLGSACSGTPTPGWGEQFFLR